jgi:hypothetical protein
VIELSVPMLFLLPIWAFGSYAAILAFPNLVVALVYFARVEEPSLSRFLIHCGLHQLATTLSIALWTLPAPEPYFSILVGTMVVAHFIALALLITSSLVIRNRLRIRHEEHLLSIAAETAVRKQQLAQKVHVPPPPSGTTIPKARPLNKKPHENER